MYFRVREKMMADAKISRACANFLSDVDLKPGLAQQGGGVNQNGMQQVRFVDINDWGWSNCNVCVNSWGLIRGSLTHRRPAPIAVLDLEYRWCRYREHLTGISSLTLFGVSLPEVICDGLARDTRQLCDLIDSSRYKPLFFIRANPLVRSIRNVTRMQTIGYGKRRRSTGLLVTMIDDWSRENWRYWSPDDGYSDRMD